MLRKCCSHLIFILFLVLAVYILLFLNLELMRYSFDRQVDDVSPNIICEKWVIDKSDILMVIPIFNNISIAENNSWCNYILGLNKTLGMHGVYHTYQEFLTARDESYIQQGIDEFKKCFGYAPSIFEAPQVALSAENEKTLKNMGFIVYDYPFQMTHKVYHCSDTGKFSNKHVDRF
jgi:predicted deacetylase